MSLIDEHTRECYRLVPGWSIRAVDTIRVIEGAMNEHSRPEHLRSDNGPEFIAYAMQDWLKAKNIQTAYIRPGAPWEPAYVESFHDKLRNELTNRELFCNLREAKVLLDAWRREYNEYRPYIVTCLRPRALHKSATRFLKFIAADAESSLLSSSIRHVVRLDTHISETLPSPPSLPRARDGTTH